MSRFFTKAFADLTPYTPGEQPQELCDYIKLNTNESPYPAPGGSCIAEQYTRRLNLYPDPDHCLVREKLSELYGVPASCIVMGNGSDELLYLSFKAFCDAEHPAYFADITYGFYPIFAEGNRVPYEEVPVDEAFRLRLSDYEDKQGTIFLANPNAPTGLALPAEEIREFAAAHPDRLIVVDEAYVDFGAESCVPFVAELSNLLVIRTFSKSRSLAGARVGFAIAQESLIRDLNTLRCSMNPYNLSSMALALAYTALCFEDEVQKNCRRIRENREFTAEGLRALGFEVLPGSANFLFARTDRIGGGELYETLKERKVLVRHFDKPRIRDYIRITIGDRRTMSTFLEVVGGIVNEKRGA